MEISDWENIANPATEIILILTEQRRAQVLAWEDARLPQEMVGLLIGRIVVGLEDEEEECENWLEEDVSLCERGCDLMAEGSIAGSGGHWTPRLSRGSSRSGCQGHW